MIVSRTIVVITTVVLCTAVAACGSGPPAPSTATRASGGPATWLLFDTSSYRRHATDAMPEMLAVARDEVASRRGRLLAAGVDGRPLTTARVVAEDFSAGAAGRTAPSLLDRFNAAKVLGLRRRLRPITQARQQVRGSGLLQALTVASSTPGDIWFWTDGIVNEDGFDISAASQRQIEAQTRLWSSRLRGRLRGRTVTLLGVGRGVARSETVERAQRLFHAVVVDAGGGRLRWSQSLAQLPGGR